MMHKYSCPCCHRSADKAFAILQVCMVTFACKEDNGRCMIYEMEPAGAMSETALYANRPNWSSGNPMKCLHCGCTATVAEFDILPEVPIVDQDGFPPVRPQVPEKGQQTVAVEL